MGLEGNGVQAKEDFALGHPSPFLSQDLLQVAPFQGAHFDVASGMDLGDVFPRQSDVLSRDGGTNDGVMVLAFMGLVMFTGGQQEAGPQGQHNGAKEGGSGSVHDQSFPGGHGMGP